MALTHPKSLDSSTEMERFVCARSLNANKSAAPQIKKEPGSSKQARRETAAGDPSPGRCRRSDAALYIPFVILHAKNLQIQRIHKSVNS
jgi:hypothetical protein